MLRLGRRTSTMPSGISPLEDVARVPVADSKVVVGSNPTLSDLTRCCAMDCGRSKSCTTLCTTLAQPLDRIGRRGGQTGCVAAIKAIHA